MALKYDTETQRRFDEVISTLKVHVRSLDISNEGAEEICENVNKEIDYWITCLMIRERLFRS
jgi:hypothetical protein